jgi:membrane-bound lytic murein transglycosylase MltF
MLFFSITLINLNELVKKPLLTSLFFILPLICGCTPSSEDIAGKADANTTRQEQIGPALGSTREAPELLDASTERCIRNYGATIKRYAGRYGLDWRLVLAIMKQESGFSRSAESHKGAGGLMQLMPVTGEELARNLELEDISHPEQNIQAGIFYLRKLYDLFEGSGEADRLKLTLAAYNAGLSRINDAQELASYLHARPAEWEGVKDALPLLSKRFYTLHRSVWGQDRPKSGWFGNAGQTLKYVDSVMDYYDDFRLALN